MPQLAIETRRPETSLVTVIPVAVDEALDADFLHKRIVEYKSEDDVFHTRFLQGVIFTVELRDKRPKHLPASAVALLKSLENEWYEVVYKSSHSSVPEPGTYVFLGEKLFEVYRLYDDHQGAFLTSFIPSTTGYCSIVTFNAEFLLTVPSPKAPLAISGKEMQVGVVAVPSRIRSRPTEANPLSGLRIAVKDNFQVQGTRTSLCNRAYYETCSPHTKTAPCIAKLENSGAHILGTTKLAAFAATEEPIECVDYQAPWNPRGDGHQSPAGSSSGSGAAIASYKWLDVAIGSDSKTAQVAFFYNLVSF